MKHFLWQCFLTGLALLLVPRLAEPSFFQHTKAYEHPDLKAGKVSVRSVLILPPRIEVERGPIDARADEGRRLEAEFARDLARVLEDHGCHVLEDKFTQEALASDIQRRYMLADFRGQADMLDAEIARKPENVQTGRYTMGYIVNKLDPNAEADALIFVRGGIYGLWFMADIAVVDARTGNVLYYATLSDKNAPDVLKKPERLAKPMNEAFKKFPGKSSGK
jgi:hypothetical protein